MILSVQEYAAACDLSLRRVRAMAAAGDLRAEKRAGAWWILDEPPVIKKAPKRGPRLSLETFDRLAAYVDGDELPLSPDQKRSCDLQLQRIADGGLPVALAYADRRGLRVARYIISPASLDHLKAKGGLLPTGISHDLAGIASGGFDAYVDAKRRDLLEALYGLEPCASSHANLTLRFVDRLPDCVRALHVVTDLAQDPSSRSVDAAASLLERVVGKPNV